MGLNYLNLTKEVRDLMLDEVEIDVEGNKLYISSRLVAGMEPKYIDLLKEAIRNHDDDWLANEIKNGGLMREREMRTRQRRTSTVKIPRDAHFILSEGEFNRFYIRGLCNKAINDGISELTVYRAKQVNTPRTASNQQIGQKVNAKDLLNDLRESIGFETYLGIPPGPNSGLSMKL